MDRQRQRAGAAARTLALCCALLAGALVSAPAAAVAAPSLNAASEYATGAEPEAVAVGDFNGDGKPDIAVANAGAGTVSVLINEGDGEFAAARTYAVGGWPVSIAVGDFYGNGRLDIAVVNLGEDITILPGNGDGTFGAPETIAVAPYAYLSSIVTGEFNGHPDLAALDPSEGRVYVLANNGEGTFAAPQVLTIPGIPRAMAVGDLTGDGEQDLVVSSGFGAYSSVSVLMGDGDGTFQSAKSYETGSEPTGVVVANLDPGAGDLPDVATANSAEGTVSVLLNRGNGELEAPRTYSSGLKSEEGGEQIAAGTLAGDAHTDLVVSGGATANAVSVLEGDGAGAFSAPVTFATGAGPTGLALGDLDGHGRSVASADSGGAGVSVLLSPFAQLTASPASLTLPAARVGEVGAPGTVTFTNTGNTTAAVRTTWLFGEAIEEGANACRGATLAPGQQCTMQASLDPTHFSQRASGALGVDYGANQSASADVSGQVLEELPPGNATVSASNTPVACPLAFWQCEVLLEVAELGGLTDEQLIKEGVEILVECKGGRGCETTILLYGSTDVLKLLTGRAASAGPRDRHGRGHHGALHGKRAPRQRRVLMGEVRVKIASGQRRTIHLRLSASGRRLLRRLKAPAKLELVEKIARPGAKTVTVSKPIELARHGRRRRHGAHPR